MQRSALCRSRRELSNAYLLAKIGVDTAENEPLEVWGENSIQYSLHSLAAPALPPASLDRTLAASLISGSATQQTRITLRIMPPSSLHNFQGVGCGLHNLNETCTAGELSPGFQFLSLTSAGRCKPEEGNVPTRI